MVTEIRDIKLKFNVDNVMFLMECSRESELYDEMILEYRDLEEEALRSIEPIILIAYDKVSVDILPKKYRNNPDGLFIVISIGDKLSELSTKAFEKGDYVVGMLLNCMADDLLFQLDSIAKKHVIKICKEKRIGIKKRLEAPNNIDMKAQYEAWEKTQCEERANIKINTSYMFKPVKTTSHIYLVDEEECRFNINHDCSECASVNCKMRQVNTHKVKVYNEDFIKDIMVKDNETLMDALLKEKIYIPGICAGSGTCGRCSVSLLKGDISITDDDVRFFTKEELIAGKRLSCRAFIKSNCSIKVNNNESKFEILATEAKKGEQLNNLENKFSIVIDIGTTTIAIQKIDNITKEVLNTYTTINRQRSYGADVINRINSANNGKREELRVSIIEDLKIGINKLVESRKKMLEQIVISANTTMIHLLLGYPCNTLGIYPFKAYSLNPKDMAYKNIFGESEELNNIKVKIIPAISTFVGGDIVSGIITCEIDKKSKVNLLLDLGTNGEMAIGNKDSILVTSTAAGPAFEGGNIKYGIGSISGAISNIEIKNNKIKLLKTLGDETPIGICGTGIVEIVSELLENKLIDETGLLNKEYFNSGYPIWENEEGNIYFTAKDVREVQLAKSAIRAGIEILIKRFNVGYEDIENLYIAGGFGYKLDSKKAMNIGMFPRELEGKISVIGNSSLEGAKIYATQNVKERVDKICNIAKEISLGNDQDFNSLYMDYMYFDEEE